MIVRLIVIGVIALASFWGGYKLKYYQVETEAHRKLIETIKQYEGIKLQLHENSLEFEQFRATAERDNKALKKKVSDAIKTDVRYSCVIPADGLHAIRESITAANGS